VYHSHYCDIYLDDIHHYDRPRGYGATNWCDMHEGRRRGNIGRSKAGMQEIRQTSGVVQALVARRVTERE
jgi:hypothetical protein